VEREILFNGSEVRAAIRHVAEQIIGEFGNEEFALLGIQKQGVPLSERLADAIVELGRPRPILGTLDISLYRDDIGTRKFLPLIRETVIPFDVNDFNLVLVDDILSSGRTIRAALDAVTDYGRAGMIRLAVLVDRNASEFPIHADYTGLNVHVPDEFKLVAEFAPGDSEDAVYKVKWLKE